LEEREEALPAQQSPDGDGARSGYEPEKLPGLRPSPQQQWKLPVGAFIEECYRKRFGGAPDSDETRRPHGESRFHADDASELAGEPMRQVEDMVCYFVNLSTIWRGGSCTARSHRKC